MTDERHWVFPQDGTPLPVEDGRHLYELGTRRATAGERNDVGARAKRVLTRAVRVPLPTYLAAVPAAASEAKRVILNGKGAMLLQPDYRWDGASGLTIDTVSCRRAALAHDACYTMLRQRRLGPSGETERRLADLWLWDLLLEDGMRRFRAAYWHWAVCRFGASAAGMQREPDRARWAGRFRPVAVESRVSSATGRASGNRWEQSILFLPGAALLLLVLS